MAAEQEWKPSLREVMEVVIDKTLERDAPVVVVTIEEFNRACLNECRRRGDFVGMVYFNLELGGTWQGKKMQELFGDNVPVDWHSEFLAKCARPEHVALHEKYLARVHFAKTHAATHCSCGRPHAAHG
jgi:hypothetical protein